MKNGDSGQGTTIYDIQVKTPDKSPKKKSSINESQKSQSFRDRVSLRSPDIVSTKYLNDTAKIHQRLGETIKSLNKSKKPADSEKI